MKTMLLKGIHLLGVVHKEYDRNPRRVCRKRSTDWCDHDVLLACARAVSRPISFPEAAFLFGLKRARALGTRLCLVKKENMLLCYACALTVHVLFKTRREGQLKSLF